MNRLFLGKMNLSKIDKERLFKGEKGTWMDVTVWFSEEPDQWGNHLSIQQSTKKDEDKIYLGSAKLYEPEKPKEEPKQDDKVLDDLGF